MVARAFCELFVAGCLEVKSEEVDGGQRRLYRAAPDLDLTLFDRVERIVVDCLRSFRSFESLLELAEAELELMLCSLQCEQPQLTDALFVPDDQPRLEPHHLASLDRELIAEAGEVLDEALEYLPPSCSCSV